VAGAYAKIEGHEELCAERYAVIASTLGELKGDAREHHKLLWSILLSFAGFMAVTLVTILLNAAKLIGD
jgi:hypothetical protein